MFWHAAGVKTMPLTKALLQNKIVKVKYLSAMMVWAIAREDIFFLQRIGVIGWKLHKIRIYWKFRTGAYL